jgi:hypothetical protein
MGPLSAIDQHLWPGPDPKRQRVPDHDARSVLTADPQRSMSRAGAVTLPRRDHERHGRMPRQPICRASLGKED